MKYLGLLLALVLAANTARLIVKHRRNLPGSWDGVEAPVTRRDVWSSGMLCAVFALISVYAWVNDL